jgi:hypothetical protein
MDRKSDAGGRAVEFGRRTGGDLFIVDNSAHRRNRLRHSGKSCISEVG